MGNCMTTAAAPADAPLLQAKATRPSSTGNQSTEKEPSSPLSSGNFKYQKGTCALEYWEPIKLLGEGSISSIHLVRRRPHRIDVPYKERVDIMDLASRNAEKSLDLAKDAEIYALKSIMKDHVTNDRYLEEMRNEVYTMSRLNHPNVAQVFEAYERKRHIYLIMEYCRGGDLYDRDVNEAQAASIIKKILTAVDYLHKHNVVHRDLKLENVMFASRKANADVKIIDFGLATRYLSNEYKNMTDKVGTIYSMAPQVLQGVYDYKCDLWSIGVIAYTLLCGEQPFWGPRREMSWPERRKIMVDRIMRCQYMRMQGGAWDDVSKEAKSFVKSLLQIDPEKRPSAAKALKSAWMRMQFRPSSTKAATAASHPVSRCTHQAKAVQIALTTIAYKSSMNEIASLRKKFQEYDRSGDGQISLLDFKAALGQTNLSESEIAFIFSESDANMAELIDYSDFVATTLEARGRIETEGIAEALERLDVDSSGRVSKDNLLGTLGDTVSDATLQETFKDVEEDEQGFVSYQDFMQVFGEKNLRRIVTLSSHHDLNDDSGQGQDLVGADDAVIPGGRNDPSKKAHYVYDAKRNSVRRCDEE